MVSATSRENHLDRASAVDLGRRCCTGLGGIHTVWADKRTVWSGSAAGGGLRRPCSEETTSGKSK